MPTSRSEAGATAVEYSILAAAIAAVIVAVVVVLGGRTCSLYETTSNEIEAANDPAATPADACG